MSLQRREGAERGRADAQRIHRASVQGEGGGCEIVGSATRRAAERSDEILRESRSSIRYGQEGRARYRAGAHQAHKELKDEVADLSVMIASKIVERDVKPEDHERFIEDFIDKVGEQTWRIW